VPPKADVVPVVGAPKADVVPVLPDPNADVPPPKVDDVVGAPKAVLFCCPKAFGVVLLPKAEGVEPNPEDRFAEEFLDPNEKAEAGIDPNGEDPNEEAPPPVADCPVVPKVPVVPPPKAEICPPNPVPALALLSDSSFPEG
jgi:hypothetical protein